MIYGLTLKPEYKKQWVDDLTSGKFIQGDGQLKKIVRAYIGSDVTITKYCCLGVFSERQGIKQVKSEHVGIISKSVEFEFPQGKDTSLPKPEWFMDYFDYTKNKRYPTKKLAVENLMDELAARNDGSGDRITVSWSFERIAGWIEKNL